MKQIELCNNCNNEMEGASWDNIEEEYDTFWCPKCGTLMNYLDLDRLYNKYQGRKKEWKRPANQNIEF